MSTPISSEQLEVLFRKLDLQAAEIAALKERVSALEGRGTGSSRSSEFELITTRPASPAAAPSSPLVLSSSGISEERREIAKSIGAWLRRCVQGELRGPSGRDRINLPSKLYLVVRDINLKSHNPPLVFFSWREAKDWCLIRGQNAESIYIGLPSKEEARVALSAAGLEFPAALQR